MKFLGPLLLLLLRCCTLPFWLLTETRPLQTPLRPASPFPLPPLPLPQMAEGAGATWESWMRSAWRRWHRTKDASNESWDAAKDSARRTYDTVTRTGGQTWEQAKQAARDAWETSKQKTGQVGRAGGWVAAAAD